MFSQVLWVEQQVAKSRAKRAEIPSQENFEERFNDKLWPQEWYLVCISILSLFLLCIPVFTFAI